MSRDSGWVKIECDGNSAHCVGTAWVKEGDNKAKNVWRDREYITKDGQTMKYTFCADCDAKWMELRTRQDDEVNAFAKPTDKE